MAIDIRATCTCSLGTLISGSISDDYLQGSGVVKTKGSCEIAGVITPAIGTVVTFSYIKNGVTRTIPRKLRVLSSFADPFRRTTKVELGCKLTYLSDLKEPVDWTAFDDPENASYNTADAEIITIPIYASSVFDKCLTELGLTASGNPLTNKFSIAKFDFGPGYVQVLADLLISESYCGYLDENEILQIISIADDGGTGPVIDSTKIIDLNSIGVGQLPGESVTVNYSTLKLKSANGDPVKWSGSSSSSVSEVSIAYTASNGGSAAEIYNSFKTTQEQTTYAEINGNNVPVYKSITQTESSINVLGSVASAYLSNGAEFGSGLSFTITEENFNYDSQGNETYHSVFTFGTADHAYGGLGVTWAFGPGDIVAVPEGIIPLSHVITTTSTNGNYRNYTTLRYGLWSESAQGQQAMAESGSHLNSSAEVASFLASISFSNLYLLDATSQSEFTIRKSQAAPSKADQINQANAAKSGNPNNGYQTQSKAELELAMGSATAQRRIELSMPYAPDDIFYKEINSYGFIKSDAEAKANLFGRVQNRLLMGNRSGCNFQLAPETLPSAPFAPFIVQANGLSALYRNNGTSWTLSADGAVVSTDALFWGAVGGTGTFWFPVSPGVSTLPTTPPIVDGQMTVTTVVPVWSETVKASGTTRIAVDVASFNYALQILKEVPAIRTKVAITAAQITKVSVPAVTVTVAAPAPSVSIPILLNAPATDVALSALVPVVSTGVALAAPVSSIALVGNNPEQAGAMATVMNVPVVDVQVAAAAPVISVGAAVAVPVTDLALAAPAPVSAGGSDALFSSVSLLLHMNGTNGSTTFTDNSSNAHTITAYGDAQISTAQSKFGGASGAFDGTGDYLMPPASSTLAMGTGNFTIETWVRFNNFSALQAVFSYGTTQLNIYANTSSKLLAYVNGTAVGAVTTLSANTWYHVALCRSGSTVRFFINGTQEGSTTSSTNFTNNQMYIGRRSDGTYQLNGYLDELRVTKAARYTAAFTAPTAPFPDS